MTTTSTIARQTIASARRPRSITLAARRGFSGAGKPTEGTNSEADISSLVGGAGPQPKQAAGEVSPPRRVDAVPAFKTAYLIHGDDHGRIGERRHRLRELAEQES